MNVESMFFGLRVGWLTGFEALDCKRFDVHDERGLRDTFATRCVM